MQAATPSPGLARPPCQLREHYSPFLPRALMLRSRATCLGHKVFSTLQRAQGPMVATPQATPHPADSQVRKEGQGKAAGWGKGGSGMGDAQRGKGPSSGHKLAL